MRDYEGHEDRSCGDHRTTGRRAWCFECHEWCYPANPCRGCELPTLREENQRLRESLLSIATDSALVYMGCSDIPHCGGRTMGDPIHQPDCVVGVAQRALGINNAGEPWVAALSEQEGQ